MSEKTNATQNKTTTTPNSSKSRSMGALWKKSGQKPDGTPWSFLSGNIEIDGKKVYITVNKSKLSDDERKASRAADYLIYKDDYVPKGKTATTDAKTEVAEEDVPF